ncbi:hypothetical protein JTB14_001668 [Gonioctena quinquepunctata]|nr:hypothetical protein JTB14_001668 [Gonioctena quinquepunctata]
MNSHGYLFSCEENNDVSIFTHFQTIFSVETKESTFHSSSIFIGNHIYCKKIIIEEIDILLRLAQTQWYLLQNVALYDEVPSNEEMLYSRELINKTFCAIIDSILLCEYPLQKDRYKSNTINRITLFTNTVLPFCELSDDIIIKLSAMKDNDPQNPLYQYLHTFLEIQYYILVSNFICGASKEVLEKHVEVMITNLIELTRKIYQRQSTSEVFGCSCTKKAWLVIQLFLEKTTEDDEFFWKIFNKILVNEDPLFTVWLLKDIARLQTYNTNLQIEGSSCERIKENYTLIRTKLKPFLLNADSDMLMKLLKLIEPLLCDLWLKNGKIEIYQTLWDYYSKRLNVSKKNYTNFNAIELNELVQKILHKLEEGGDDFEHFIGMLICQLRNYPEHWGKMKGRIYSQLGPNKLKELSETGITHVMLLFIALSTINYEEAQKKIVSFFEYLPPEKRNTPLVWNIYMTFIFTQVRNGHSLEKTTPPLLSSLQETSADNKNFRLIKGFIVNLQHLLNFSSNMQLGQSAFLNSWLSKYLLTCYYADLTLTLDVLVFTLEKVESPDSWSIWMAPFKEHVLPVLKQVSSSQNPPGSIGKIAGKLCLLIPNSSSEIFNFFTSENISPKISSQFLTIVLMNYPSGYILNSQQEAQVVMSWVKICLLTIDSSDSLTKNVLKLDLFPATLRSHISTSRDSIYAFIEYLGSDIKQHLQSANIMRLCELSFGHLDKWLSEYLTQPESEAVVFRVYTFMSLAFLHCGGLLYSWKKSSSPLTRLTQCLLMPNDLLIGKSLHEFVLNAVKKTWHLFYEALVKMRTESDMFVERMLRDMITKYMQYFSTGDSPIIKCLESESIAPVLLEKICNSYFKHPVKESDANLLKVLKILIDSVQSTTSIPLMKIIVDKTLYGLFEVIIFHSQRNFAITLIKTITCSPLYPQIRTEFGKEVIAITVKHMAFNTINYFQLMMILAKFVPSDIKDLLVDVKQQVINVERLRGVGFDNNLRLQFEKLESALRVPR